MKKMSYKKEWLNACFNSKKAEKTAYVERGCNDYIGPYSLQFAFVVAKDLGNAKVIDTETGEILN